MSVEVYVLGDRELLYKLKNLKRFFNSSQFMSITDNAGQEYVSRARWMCPISHNPMWGGGFTPGGNLRNSIAYQVVNFGTTEVKIVMRAGGPNAPYASHVEFGTGESPRYAKNKAAMFWIEDGSGTKVITPPGLYIPLGLIRSKGYMAHIRQRVWHPGTKAQPFFYQQMPIVVPRMMNDMRMAIEQQWAARGVI